MEFKKVTILGGGVLGMQIAMQSAYCGKDVTIWLRSEDSKTRTQPKLDRLYGVYEKTLEQMNKTKAPADFCGGLADSYETFDYKDCVARAQDAKNHITLTTDMAEAVKDADIVIEATAENEKQKIGVFEAVAKVLDKDQLIVTNSSSCCRPSSPSMFRTRRTTWLCTLRTISGSRTLPKSCALLTPAMRLSRLPSVSPRRSRWSRTRSSKRKPATS